MKLLIASKNRGKVLEIRSLLGLALQKVVEVVTLAELPDLDQPRESGQTFAENARIKAIHYAKAHRILCIADDSGLSVDALRGLPGVRSARFAGEGASDAENNAHLLHELAPFARPWKAAFVCVAAAALPHRVVAEATGKVEGEILPEGRGRDGFGYDPLFFVPS
ncbi:MAG: Ribonuclease, partial [Deltaproteobacteria bacterium]|nr:Ribonuclease [Deltaproteobacteria bacterium]